jgi:hypothetical protein
MSSVSLSDSHTTETAFQEAALAVTIEGIGPVSTASDEALERLKELGVKEGILPSVAGPSKEKSQRWQKGKGKGSQPPPSGAAPAQDKGVTMSAEHLASIEKELKELKGFVAMELKSVKDTLAKISASVTTLADIITADERDSRSVAYSPAPSISRMRAPASDKETTSTPPLITIDTTKPAAAITYDRFYD